MKVLVLDSPVNEPDIEPIFLEENEIQGLYPAKGAIESFWSLLSKIELAIFQDHRNGETKHEKRHTKR